MEITKQDKKALKQLIDIALKRDFERIMTETDLVLADWKSQTKDARQSYYDLFEKIRISDKYISRTYDNLTGSHYFDTVISLFVNERLTMDELSVCRPELKSYLLTLIDLYK